jgi:hypothetical protein
VASLAGEARILDAFGPGVVAELRAGRTLVVEDCLTADLGQHRLPVADRDAADSGRAAHCPRCYFPASS